MTAAGTLRSSWIVLGLALAAPAGARADAPPDPFEPGAARDLPRVRVLAYGVGFLGAGVAHPLAPAGKPPIIAADSLVTLPALGDGEATVPVLLGGTDVRLIVSVPASLLATVALDDAFVQAAPSAGEPPETGRARIRPGVIVRPGAAVEGGWHRLRHVTPELEVKGVIRADRIGHAYPETRGFLDGGDAEVRGDAQLLDHPGGKVLARLRRGRAHWLGARVLGEPNRGHVRVRVTVSDVQVEAWVDRADLRRVPPFGTGGSWATGVTTGLTGRRPGPKIELPRGTRLLAAPGGEEVGRILRDSAHDRAPGPDGEPPRIVIHTRFGDAVVVAAAP